MLARAAQACPGRYLSSSEWLTAIVAEINCRPEDLDKRRLHKLVYRLKKHVAQVTTDGLIDADGAGRGYRLATPNVVWPAGGDER